MKCVIFLASICVFINVNYGFQQVNQGTPSEDGTQSSSEPNDSPENEIPESESPETVSPEGTSPESSNPEGASPEGSSPDSSSPEGASPDSSSPEGASPNSSSPEGASLEGASPDSSSPEGARPDSSNPEGAGPEGASPESSSTQEGSESSADLDDEHIVQMIQTFENEMAAGDQADMFGPNRHGYIPNNYADLSRRFVLQYPYKEVSSRESKADEEMIPIKAPPELVLALAKESLRTASLKPARQFEEKDILRTGDYWNAVWQEDVKPKDILRTQNKRKRNLNTIKARVLPGSSLYELVVQLKQTSPQLLYIINKK